MSELRSVTHQKRNRTADKHGARQATENPFVKTGVDIASHDDHVRSGEADLILERVRYIAIVHKIPIFDGDPYSMMSQPRRELRSRNCAAEVSFSDNRKDLDGICSLEERQRIGDRPGGPGTPVPCDQHMMGKSRLMIIGHDQNWTPTGEERSFNQP